MLQAIPLLEVDRRTGRVGHESRDGLGIGEPGDPMYTLQSKARHGVFVFEAKQSGESSTVEMVVELRKHEPELNLLASVIWGMDLGGDAVAVAKRLYERGVRVDQALLTEWDVRRMREREEMLARLDAMTDEDIRAQIAANPDAAPELDQAWFDRAQYRDRRREPYPYDHGQAEYEGPIPFDRSQITHPENRSNPQPGDPSPTLKSDGKPPHVIGFHSTGGSQGVGAGDDVSPTIAATGSTGHNVPAAVYVIDRQNATAGPDLVGTLDTAQENARGKAVYDAVTVMAPRRLTPTECSRLMGLPDTWLDIDYADAAQAHASQVLQCLWEFAAETAREGWRSGVAASLLTPEVLLAGVYGGWISWEMAFRCAAEARASASAESWPEGFVSRLREYDATTRPTPYRRESFEQLAGELGRFVSLLPLEEAQAVQALLTSELWQEASQEWPLRSALAAGEARRPSASDSAKYRAIGNSVAVPCVEWIARRIVSAHQEIYG